MRQTVRYVALGPLLAAGAPLGLFVLHALAAGAFSWSWGAAELREHALDYIYIEVSTTMLFLLLGVLLARREERLRASALTDALTGLPNRRHFDRQLGIELARALRNRQPLSLLFIDVDRLKEINDRGGHSAGDRALSQVAAAIWQTARATDVTCRYGGDEFAVLAPGSAAGAGVALAERIRCAVKSGASGVSVSIGVVDLDDVREADAGAICGAADRALYRAKEQGRDCVARLEASTWELGPLRSN